MKRPLVALLALACATPLGCGDRHSPKAVDDGGTSNDGGDGSTVVDPAFDPCASIPPGDVVVDGNITTNTTWCTGHTYRLKRRTYVIGNSTLTIQPGVVVTADPTRALEPDPDAALVITMGSKIDAVGTATEPIVFTSYASAGNRGQPDVAFGGLVLFGQAPVNAAAVAGGSVTMEGLESRQLTANGVTVEANEYGGNDPASSCGTLKYVRVEFAGYAFTPAIELNGITFGACGSGTKVSYVQVHRAWDDGMEFLGGGPSLDHIVITGSDDDGLDFDYGFTGRIQFAIVHQYGTGNNDKGIESDNDSNGTKATPRTNPEIYNLTLLGPGSAGRASQRCMHMRRATLGRLHHVICDSWGDDETAITPTTTSGVFFEPPPTTNEASYVATHWAAATDGFVVDHSIFRKSILPALDYTGCDGGDCWNAAMAMKGADGTLDSAAEQLLVFAGAQSIDTATLLSDAARYNDVGASSSASLFTVPDLTTPDYCPLASRVVVTGDATAPTGWTGFDSAGLEFAGGCARTSTADPAWYEGWTSFPAT